MGCDIHMRAEIEKKGKWEMAQKAFKSSYYKEGDSYFGTDEYLHSDEPYSGRNYDLFACLADVRNGRGFAGIQTGDGFNPIALPKGIPDDASVEWQETYYESCKHFVDETIPMLEKLGDPDKVRIVFFFDN